MLIERRERIENNVFEIFIIDLVKVRLFIRRVVGLKFEIYIEIHNENIFQIHVN